MPHCALPLPRPPHLTSSSGLSRPRNSSLRAVATLSHSPLDRQYTMPHCTLFLPPAVVVKRLAMSSPMSLTISFFLGTTSYLFAGGARGGSGQWW